MRRLLKSALCATLLPATSCAYTRSSVTLYGSVDNLFDVSNQGEGTVAKLTNGGPFGSRWGLEGTKDLGGGYKAIFKLEDGISSTPGVIGKGGPLFGRTSWMGLQGPQGSLTFGRQYAPEFLAVAEYGVFCTALGGSLLNIDRTLANRLVESTLMADVLTGQARHHAGPLGLHSGYIRLKYATGPGSYVEWGIGGTYEIGPTKLYAGYLKDLVGYQYPNSRRFSSSVWVAKYWVKVSSDFSFDVNSPGNREYRHFDGPPSLAECL